SPAPFVLTPVCASHPAQLPFLHVIIPYLTGHNKRLKTHVRAEHIHTHTHTHRYTIAITSNSFTQSPSHTSTNIAEEREISIHMFSEGTTYKQRLYRHSIYT